MLNLVLFIVIIAPYDSHSEQTLKRPFDYIVSVFCSLVTRTNDTKFFVMDATSHSMATFKKCGAYNNT